MPFPRAWPALLALACSGNAGSNEPAQVAPPAAIESPAPQVEPPPPAPPPRGLPRPFDGRVQMNLGARPVGVAWADVDGDGALELLATTEEPGELRVWHRAEGGLAPQPARFATGGWPLPPVVAAPGSFETPVERRAVLVASRKERTLRCLDVKALTPSTTDLAGTVLLALPSPPRALAAGASAATGPFAAVATDEQLILLGSKGLRSEAPLTGQFPRAALALPGEPMVAVAFQQPPSLALYEASRSSPLSRAALPAIPRALAAFDVDADGDLELAVAAGANALLVFGWQQPGGIGAALEGSDPKPHVIDVGTVPIALDATADGRSLIVASLYSLSTELLRPVPSANALPEPLFREYAGQSPIHAALGDADGDGLPDLAVANRDSHTLSLSFGEADAPLGRTHHSFAGGFPVSVDLGNEPATERALVAVACSKEGVLALLESRRGGPLAAWARLDGGPAPREVRWVELDGDGRMDLAWLWSDASGARLARRRALASGGFEAIDRTLDPRVGASAKALLLERAPSGPTREFWIADPEAGQVACVVGNEVTRVGVPNAPQALEWIDFDGDPEPELAVALGTPGPRVGVAVLDVVREGSSVALRELSFHPSSRRPIDLAVADLDRDGLEDALLLCRETDLSPSASVEALRRVAGGGGFALVAEEEAGLMPHHLALVELDGQRFLAVPAQNLHAVLLWRVAAGEGRFALERLDDLGAHLGCMEAAFGDVNGDGRPDMVVANGYSDDVSVVPARSSAWRSPGSAGR